MHDIVRTMADDDRKHDPWGAGMNTLGAVCDVLHHEGGTIPTEVRYSPGMGGPIVTYDATTGEGYHANELMAGLHPEQHPGYWVKGYAPNLTIADLEHAAIVLHRYLNLVKLAGRDY